MSTPLLNYASGQVEQVPDDQVQGYVSGGKYGLPKGMPLPLLDPSGKVIELEGEQATQKMGEGFQFLGADGAAALRQAEKYGDRPVSAFAAGAARTLTFGGSDALATGTGAVEPETLKGLEEHNPGATIAGEATGAVGPLLLSGGAAAPEEAAALGTRGLLSGAARAAAAPVRAVSALGEATAGAVRGVVGEGLAGRVAGGAARGLAEAPAYHLQSKITEAAISNKPLDSQLLLSDLGPSLGLGLVGGGSLEGALGLAKAVAPLAKGAVAAAGHLVEPLAEGLETKMGDRVAGAMVHHGMSALLGHGLGPVGVLAAGALHHAVSEGLIESGVIRTLMERSAKVAGQLGRAVDGLLEGGVGAAASTVGYLAQKGEDRYQGFQRHAQELTIASVDPQHTAARMSAQTEGLLSQAAPGLVAELHATSARAAAYLAGQLPRNPMPPNPLLGPQKWQPSDAELAAYERKARAVEEPHTILHDAKAGTLTQEAMTAVQTVYPDLVAHIQSKVLQGIAARSPDAPALPYARRLQLSTLLGTPLDPSLNMLPTLQQAAQGGQAPGGQPPGQGASGPRPSSARASKISLADASASPFSGGAGRSKA